MPCSAVLKLLIVNLPVVESWNAAIAIAIVGAIRPRATYTPNGTTPSHLSAPRSDGGDPAGPGPGGEASGAAAWVVLPPLASRRLAWPSSG